MELDNVNIIYAALFELGKIWYIRYSDNDNNDEESGEDKARNPY